MKRVDNFFNVFLLQGQKRKRFRPVSFPPNAESEAYLLLSDFDEVESAKFETACQILSGEKGENSTNKIILNDVFDAIIKNFKIF